MKHTEGPWFVTRGAQEHPFSIESGTKTIALVKMQSDRRETELNAGLLHVAPELLEALKIAVEYFNNNGGKKAYSWLEQMEKAINKAEGK